MSAIRKKFAKFAVSVVIVFLFNAKHSKVLATQAIMNPVEVVDPQEIRNGHGHVVLAEEPPTETLTAELRTPPPTSEVIQLLEEDDTRTGDQASKNQNGMQAPDLRMDCSKITMQIFQVLLQNPDTVEPEDYSCGLLNLISHFEKFNSRIRFLEGNLHTATTTIKSLESSLLTEMSKSQFLMKELNETVHKETDRAIRAENVIARRILAEKSRVDTIQKNVTELLTTGLEQVKDVDEMVRNLEMQLHGVASKQLLAKEPQGFSPSPQLIGHLQPSMMGQSGVNEQEIFKIELKLNNLQDFIQELSNRIAQMENGSEEHVNKGITQIFKTYASLAHEIEKETERATGEEANIKALLTNEISALTKLVTGLQDRITEEKNRVQVIENRRTADLFEEINRAKSEENRLGQKLKDEMSKAAAAFKRLETHVDGQLNTSRVVDFDIKAFEDNITRRAVEAQEKLLEQINFEKSRAISVETSLKAHLETEVTRAMAAENELKKLAGEEKERARLAEHDLMVALDVEAYRAKGAEFSLSAQITAETERAKQEESELDENVNANVTRLLTDIIKEFTRAQNAEKELEDSIRSEKTRALAAEQGLTSNINAEMNRARDREQELFSIMKMQGNSSKVVDQVRGMIEVESFRAAQKEANIEGQIQAEISRAKAREDKLYSMMNNDLLDRFRSVEYNVTSTTHEILRHSKELELEVRKTVMAEVARAVDAENGLKQQLGDEKERLSRIELTLASSVNSNYSDISVKLQEMSTNFEKDSLRLEDISLQISRNLTGDILTLAELFDDKLDDLERNENSRLKKIEEDMKKCCSGSSWRWRAPKGNGKSTAGNASTSEGVINKIMQAFGSITDIKNTGKSSSRGSKKDTNSTGRSISSSEVSSDDEEKQDHQVKPDKSGYNKAVINASRNETVISSLPIVSNNLGNSEKLSRKRLSIINGRNSRKADGSSNRDSISVQSINSKVTSTFG